MSDLKGSAVCRAALPAQAAASMPALPRSSAPASLPPPPPAFPAPTTSPSSVHPGALPMPSCSDAMQGTAPAGAAGPVITVLDAAHSNVLLLADDAATAQPQPSWNTASARRELLDRQSESLRLAFEQVHARLQQLFPGREFATVLPAAKPCGGLSGKSLGAVDEGNDAETAEKASGGVTAQSKTAADRASGAFAATDMKIPGQPSISAHLGASTATDFAAGLLEQTGPLGAAAMPPALSAAEIEQRMPRDVSEKLAALFQHASRAIRQFLTGRASRKNLIEDPQKAGLQALSGLASAAKTGLGMAKLAQAPLVKEAGAAAGIGTLPLTLVSAAQGAVDLLDVQASQRQCWRELMRHYDRAVRYFNAAQGSRLAVQKGDADHYRIFSRVLGKLPEFSAGAAGALHQARLDFSQRVGTSLSNSVLDNVADIGSRLQTFTPVVCSALSASGGALKIVGGALDIADGVSKIGSSARARNRLETRQHVLATQVDDYRQRLDVGQRRLLGTIRRAITHHHEGALKQLEFDRRLAIAKITRGCVAVTFGMAFLGLGIAAAFGLALPPVGIVLGVAAAVATTIYFACAGTRAHKRGQYIVLAEARQHQAHQLLRGASLAQMSSMYLGEMEEYVEIAGGVFQPRLAISEAQLADNLYFSLHFMARVLENKQLRRLQMADDEKILQTVLAGATPSRQQRLASWRSAAPVGIAASDGAVNPEDALHAQQSMPHTLADQLAVEQVITELLLSCGLSSLDLAALEQSAEDAPQAERFDGLMRNLAESLGLQFVEQAPPLARPAPTTAQ